MGGGYLSLPSLRDLFLFLSKKKHFHLPAVKNIGCKTHQQPFNWRNPLSTSIFSRTGSEPPESEDTISNNTGPGAKSASAWSYNMRCSPTVSPSSGTGTDLQGFSPAIEWENEKETSSGFGKEGQRRDSSELPELDNGTGVGKASYPIDRL